MGTVGEKEMGVSFVFMKTHYMYIWNSQAMKNENAFNLFDE